MDSKPKVNIDTAAPAIDSILSKIVCCNASWDQVRMQRNYRCHPLSGRLDIVGALIVELMMELLHRVPWEAYWIQITAWSFCSAPNSTTQSITSCYTNLLARRKPLASSNRMQTMRGTMGEQESVLNINIPMRNELMPCDIVRCELTWSVRSWTDVLRSKDLNETVMQSGTWGHQQNTMFLAHHLMTLFSLETT